LIIHNIYVINHEGLCPLSITLGSIEADPEMVAGVLSASQKFWGEITGEIPEFISFQSMRAYLKSFSTGSQNWYLVIITEFENAETMEKVENALLNVIDQHKTLFEEFVADTTEIKKRVTKEMIRALSRIPCPYVTKKLFRHVCGIDNLLVEGASCNMVSVNNCKDKIKEHSRKKSSIIDAVDDFFKKLEE